MQAPTLTLTELVFGPICSSLDPTDRALQIAELIASHAEMEAEIEQLRGEVAEDRDFAEERDELREILKKLVDAIDGAKVGKIAKVGGLVIIESSPVNLAESLGDALKAAREAL